MGLMKELNDLNNIYHQMNKQEVSEDQDKGYVVTNADRKQTLLLGKVTKKV